LINVEDSCNIIIITGQRETALKIIYNIYRVLRFPVAFLLPDRRPSHFTPTDHIYILHTHIKLSESIGRGRTIFSIIATSTSLVVYPATVLSARELPSTVHFARITERTSSAFICGGVRPRRSTQI